MKYRDLAIVSIEALIEAFHYIDQDKQAKIALKLVSNLSRCCNTLEEAEGLIRGMQQSCHISNEYLEQAINIIKGEFARREILKK